MIYETPTIDEIGEASKLIETYVGPRYDGGGDAFSQACVCSTLEEE